MKWIGLTGGIATGKSTVSRLFESRGVPVIDADKISHSATKIGAEGYNLILKEFGTEYLLPDLRLDRQKLGDLVFKQIDHRKKLEAILHPIIQAEVQSLRQTHRDNGHLKCIYDVPLLFESKLESHYDETIVVWCDVEVQIERLMQRNRIDREQALLRISNQMPLSEKIKKATHCIDNSGDELSLIHMVDQLIDRL